MTGRVRTGTRARTGAVIGRHRSPPAHVASSRPIPTALRPSTTIIRWTGRASFSFGELGCATSCTFLRSCAALESCMKTVATSGRSFGSAKNTGEPRYFTSASRRSTCLLACAEIARTAIRMRLELTTHAPSRPQSHLVLHRGPVRSQYNAPVARAAVYTLSAHDLV
jgi:hypothetical protein